MGEKKDLGELGKMYSPLVYSDPPPRLINVVVFSKPPLLFKLLCLFGIEEYYVIAPRYLFPSIKLLFLISFDICKSIENIKYYIKRHTASFENCFSCKLSFWLRSVSVQIASKLKQISQENTCSGASFL